MSIHMSNIGSQGALYVMHQLVLQLVLFFCFFFSSSLPNHSLLIDHIDIDHLAHFLEAYHYHNIIVESETKEKAKRANRGI